MAQNFLGYVHLNQKLSNVRNSLYKGILKEIDVRNGILLENANPIFLKDSFVNWISVIFGSLTTFYSN